MAVFTDGNIVFGVFPDGIPPIINLPENAHVKIVARSTELTKVFIRHRNGDFTAWHVEWADDTHKSLRLWYPFGANVRKKT